MYDTQYHLKNKNTHLLFFIFIYYFKYPFTHHYSKLSNRQFIDYIGLSIPFCYVLSILACFSVAVKHTTFKLNAFIRQYKICYTIVTTAYNRKCFCEINANGTTCHMRLAVLNGPRDFKSHSRIFQRLPLHATLTC